VEVLVVAEVDLEASEGEAEEVVEPAVDGNTV